MADDEDALLGVALHLIDGTSIDWSKAGSGLEPTEQRFLTRLRQLETLAHLHGKNHGPAVSESLGATTPLTNAMPLRWGPLEILEKVGRGSYGDVYRARDPRLDREVALKLLRRSDGLAGDEWSLVQEGQALARLRHPNVVTVYGATTTEGRTGLWMEFIDGRTLLDEVRERGPLPVAEIVQIGHDLCGAVDAVHQSGLLHRDIKAQNVMRASDGRIVLMDFGAGRDGKAEGTEGVAGTPLYLAPEVLAGGPTTIRSEVYSLGVLLWFLATKDFPVTGQTIDEIRASHREGVRTRELRAVRPDIPRRLAAVIHRCLEPDAHRRAKDVGAVKAALARTGTFPRRLRVAVAAAAIAALVSVGGFVAWQMNDAGSATQVPFASGDLVLRIPFVNATGDASLDGIVDAALDRELSQSSVVRIASRQRIGDALQLMQKPAGTPLDLAIAREICQRDKQIRIIQTGRIERNGEQLILTAGFVDPWSGRTLTNATARARGSQGLEHAIRQLAERLRSALGESAAAIRENARQLENVTTPSLEALRAYSESYRLATSAEPRSWQAAQVLVQRALAIDPEFPAARIWYALTLYSLDATPVMYRAAAQSAFDVVESTTPWEQHWIRGLHHLLFEELENAAAEFEAMLALKPDHEEAQARLHRTYIRLRRLEDAARIAVARANLRPNDLSLASQAILALGRMGGFDRARELIERVELLLDGGEGDSPRDAAALYTLRAYDAIRRRQPDEAVRLLDGIAGRFPQWSPSGRRYLAEQLRSAYFALGRIGEARRHGQAVPLPNERGVLLAAMSRFAGDRGAARREIAPVSVQGLKDEGMLYLGSQAVSHMIWAGLLAQGTRELRTLEILHRDPRAAEIAPAVPPSAALDGELAFARGDFDRAAALLEQGWKEGSAHTGMRARIAGPLADLLVRRGERERAVSLLQETARALEGGVQPNFPPYVITQLKLADVLREMGNVAAAQQIERDLRALLAAADADLPILVNLQQRAH